MSIDPFNAARDNKKGEMPCRRKDHLILVLLRMQEEWPCRGKHVAS